MTHEEMFLQLVQTGLLAQVAVSPLRELPQLPPPAEYASQFPTPSRPPPFDTAMTAMSQAQQVVVSGGLPLDVSPLMLAFEFLLFWAGGEGCPEPKWLKGVGWFAASEPEKDNELPFGFRPHR